MVELNQIVALRRYFGGWFSGSAIYAHGLMFSYILFASTFGPLYSIKSLISLGLSGLSNPFPLISFLIRFSFITYFAIPLGQAFTALRRGSEKRRILKVSASGLLIAACILGIVKFIDDTSTVLSLICFTSLTILMLFSRDKTPYKREDSYREFGVGFVTFYCVYVIILFMQLSPKLDVASFTQLISFFSGLLNIQILSLPFALITTPIAIGVAHKGKPSEIWFSFVSSLLLLIFAAYLSYLVEASFFAVLSLLLFWSYASENLSQTTSPTASESKAPLRELLDEGDSTIRKPGEANPDGITRLADTLSTLAEEASLYFKIKATEAYGETDSRGDASKLLDTILRPLTTIAREAELFRELKTGEILKVKKIDDYVPPIKRIVTMDGKEKNAGVIHYLICSRTGHGKTTLMKNFIKTHADFSYMILDRHHEYGDSAIRLDAVLDVSELDRILAQVPGSELVSGRSILREAQVFSLEQQFDRAVDSILSDKFMNDITEPLFRGQNVILQPGTVPEMIYSRIAQGIVRKVLERKMQKREERGIVVVNEEAQNSFEVTEDGLERNKAHPLLNVIFEGRKYNVSIINITSDPENIPKNIKDNSILILGSIGAPAIKRMVGEKLGMIYIRYIYELPVGYFFMDQPDSDGQYVVFPNHLGNREP